MQDPIEIVHFDFVTIDNNNETGLFLYLETKYDCYSKDEEFMNSAHQIEAKICEYFGARNVSYLVYLLTTIASDQLYLSVVYPK